jgi:hypothetical protein
MAEKKCGHPNNETLEVCGFYSLERRWLIADLILLYKIFNKLVVVNFGSAFHLLANSVTRGHCC